MDLPPLALAALVAAAFTAGFIDAIAGGGGLVTVPALLAVGLPPHLALGTNKGQAVWGSGAALANFAVIHIGIRSGKPGAESRITFAGRTLAGIASSSADMVQKPALLNAWITSGRASPSTSRASLPPKAGQAPGIPIVRNVGVITVRTS